MLYGYGIKRSADAEYMRLGTLSERMDTAIEQVYDFDRDASGQNIENGVYEDLMYAIFRRDSHGVETKVFDGLLREL